MSSSSGNSVFLDDSLFQQPHFKSAVKTFQECKLNWNVVRAQFPITKYLSDGDQFFNAVWDTIDNAKVYAWIMTYAMDDSIPASTILHKLIEARKRGVNTVLLVDDLQQSVDPDLLAKYRSLGGVFQSLNPMFKLSSLKKFRRQEIFRRHHQKLFVSDQSTMIGSSNLETGYAGVKYGRMRFRDFNLLAENINLQEFRNYIGKTADYYKFELSPGKPNKELLQEYNQAFPNSQFYNKNTFKFLTSHQPQVREIQDEVLKNIEASTKSIFVVQPYYFPVKKFQNAIIKDLDTCILAMERGVQVTLITSAKRDQPAYKSLKNGLLMKKLIRKGMQVFESHNKLLHTKAFIFDGKIMNLGSFNADRWSWKINNEANVCIYSQEECLKAKPYFDALLKECKAVTKNPKVDFGTNIILGFWEKFLYLSEVVMSKTRQLKLHKLLSATVTTSSSDEQKIDT